MLKRKQSHLLILTILAFTFFCGCASTGASSTGFSSTGSSSVENSSNGDLSCSKANSQSKSEAVELTFGSWRLDDAERMNKLFAEYKSTAPNVTVNFQPTNPPDYNNMLRVQLESGTGPDLICARSYETGEELFNEGYFADCTDIPGLKENFDEESLAPWQTAEGKSFAVPFAAVSQVIFYNKDIFKDNEIVIPSTWDEFIAACDKLQAAGVTPLANGVAEEWDALECLALAMVPNYIGGADERVKYETGEKKLNDGAFVSLFTDIQGLAKYMPVNFEEVMYGDSLELFGSGSAAMFFDGSWAISHYGDAEFNWGVFAIPARKAEDTAVVFHPDMAITVNAATEHPDEAIAFLEWLCNPQSAVIVSNLLSSGFFPMSNAEVALDDPHANECLTLTNGKTTDVRFTWPKLTGLYTPMNQEVVALIKGLQTPQGAADVLNEAARELLS